MGGGGGGWWWWVLLLVIVVVVVVVVLSPRPTPTSGVWTAWARALVVGVRGGGGVVGGGDVGGVGWLVGCLPACLSVCLSVCLFVCYRRHRCLLFVVVGVVSTVVVVVVSVRQTYPNSTRLHSLAPEGRPGDF